MVPAGAPANGPRSAGGPLRHLGHFPELDSLRGIALVFVLLAHLWIIWPTWTFHTVFAEGGFVGVDMFFVLSGFLITALLLEEQGHTGTVDLLRFTYRRTLRLFPALWLLLLAQLTYAIAFDYPPFGRSDWEWSSLRASFLYYMNWHALWHPLAAADLTPIWSLSIEAQFYLVWPFVVLGVIGLQRSRRATTGLLVATLVAVSVWRLVLFETHGWEAAYLRSDSHIDGLLVGALVACAWVRRWTPDRLPRWLLVPAGALVVALFTQLKADGRFAYAGGTTLVILATGLAVLVMATTPRTQLGIVGRTTALLGRVSYGIYLWHFPVLWAVTREGTGWSNEQRLAVVVGITTVGVVVSRFLVELPALSAKPPRPGEPASRVPGVSRGRGGRGDPAPATPASR